MPRLKKGQVAPGVRAKQERAQKSVQAIIGVLNEAVRLGRFSPEDGKLFGRMSDLEMMHDVSRGIAPMSVRTFRENVERMYPGGMKAFRATIAELGRDSVVSPAETVMEMGFEDAILDMTARYSDLLQRFKRVSLESDAAADEIKRHFDRYRSHGTLRVVK